MRFAYTGIRVRDLERSTRFYKNAMRMRVVRRGRMEAGGAYVHLKSPGSAQVLELNWYPPGSQHDEPFVAGSELDHLAFWCRDVLRERARLLAGGAKAALEPWDEDGYTLAFVRDPDGIWIELIGRQRAQKGRRRG